MLNREYNFNKDISYLDNMKEWFFSSNILEDKEIFSYTDDFNQIIEELEEVKVINKKMKPYTEYEVLYIDFKERSVAKVFLKNFNEYIGFCEKDENKNLPIEERIRNFNKKI